MTNWAPVEVFNMDLTAAKVILQFVGEELVGTYDPVFLLKLREIWGFFLSILSSIADHESP